MSGVGPVAQALPEKDRALVGVKVEPYSFLFSENHLWRGSSISGISFNLVDVTCREPENSMEGGGARYSVSTLVGKNGIKKSTSLIHRQELTLV